MTLNGAIAELVMLHEHSMMPDVFKPSIQKIIETVSECEEPPAQPEWIPCSERLPEQYGNYLATMCDGDVQECTYSPEKNTRFMRGGWSTCESDGILFLDVSEVIAWMPLPEPYERRQDADR